MLTTILIGIAILLFVLFIAIAYVKAPPDMAYIISGITKQPRILIGKASLRVPFFERLDKLTLELIQVDVRTTKVPTAEFINIDVDAVANIKIPKDPELIRVAAQNFLNNKASAIGATARQVLEGNMREIVGTMELKSLVNDRSLFASKVQENVQDDMKKMGLQLINLNVQNFTDDNNAINDLGIDNLAKIKKDAAIAKANAERDVLVKASKADEEGAQARAEADAKIAEQQKILEIKKSEYKKEQDIKSAEADAAYQIQQELQKKTVNENAVNAEVAKAERMAELKEKEIALKEKELDATIKKQADADRYAEEQKAEAEKNVRKQKAEAELYEAEKRAAARKAQAEADKEAALLEAQGIEAKLKAEAEGNKAILLAEAEGIDKKAEAMKKMGEAAVLEMAFQALPQIAKEVSAPLANVDNITMYGEGNTTKLIGEGTKNISQITDLMKNTLGLNLGATINNFLNKEKVQ